MPYGSSANGMRELLGVGHGAGVGTAEVLLTKRIEQDHLRTPR